MGITIKQLSEMSGYSCSTISRVITNKGNVKAETREAVERLLMEQNYRTNVMELRMAGINQRTIMIIVGDLDNWFYMEMIRGIQRRVAEEGYISVIGYSDNEEKAEQKLSDVIQGNGLGWTKDSKKMYFIDSQTYTVQEFDFDLEKGSISNGRIAVEVPKEMGLPDGMTVDDDGMLWIALWGGGCVSRWNPKTGELLCKIEVPAKNVTACTFGGPDMNELYITTAKMDTDEEQYPHAGGLFKIKLDITGTPSYRYQG